MYAAHLDAQYSMLQGKRILIVEDEALAGMLAEEELLDAGAEVIGPAYTLEEALQMTEEAAADGGLSAAVLDINLAGVAVWPVADRLAALGVPFVLSTGYDDNHNPSLHAAAPRLVKPFDLDALVAIIQQLAVRGHALETPAEIRETT
jgi:DNA-binding response OmpR family regulator